MRHSRIIDMLGGNTALAEVLGRHNSAPSRWRVKGIPPHLWPAIVRVARSRNLTGITIEALSEGIPRHQRFSERYRVPLRVAPGD